MEAKKKILVVDDEPSVTFTISAFLKRVGPDYDMIRAFDKDKALSIIESERPQVILLDIDLAGINAGLELLEIINTKYKDIKPIVITGHAKDYRSQIEEIGCFAYFEKPADLRMLSNKIKEAFGIKQIIEDLEIGVLKAKPKAKLLFIEPNIHIYAYLCSIFDNKEMLNGADYIVKVIDDIDLVLTVLMEYQPDIVLIGDYFMHDGQILSLIDLILQDIKIKPDSIIVHGLFERNDIFEVQLKKKGIKHCIQNVMDQDQLIKMNRKLANAVARECIERGLVKK